MFLSIPAWRLNKYLSLHEILSHLGRFMTDFDWHLQVAEMAPEPGSAAVEQVGPGEALSLAKVLELFAADLQMIDGELTGTSRNAVPEQYLIIRAVDSTSWDIESNMEDVLSMLVQSYPETTVINDSGSEGT